MTAERDSMTLKEVSLPALGAEERSDEAPRAGRARPTPDPEVVAKPKRRQFSAEYRLKWTLLLGPLSAVVKRIPSDSLRDKIWH